MKLSDSFFILSIHYFSQWYNAKFLSPWPKLDCASVLLETINDNLFHLLSDINALIREVCKQYNKRIEWPKIGLKGKFIVDTNWDNMFLPLLNLTIISENNLEKKDIENDLDIIMSEKNYE